MIFQFVESADFNDNCKTWADFNGQLADLSSNTDIAPEDLPRQLQPAYPLLKKQSDFKLYLVEWNGVGYDAWTGNKYNIAVSIKYDRENKCPSDLTCDQMRADAFFLYKAFHEGFDIILLLDQKFMIVLIPSFTNEENFDKYIKCITENIHMEDIAAEESGFSISDGGRKFAGRVYCNVKFNGKELWISEKVLKTFLELRSNTHNLEKILGDVPEGALITGIGISYTTNRLMPIWEVPEYQYSYFFYKKFSERLGYAVNKMQITKTWGEFHEAKSFTVTDGFIKYVHENKPLPMKEHKLQKIFTDSFGKVLDVGWSLTENKTVLIETVEDPETKDIA